MNIIETNLSFGSMSNRSSTERIILHHAEASSCSAEQIHQWHLSNGWSGAGYHFLVRKDGGIYRLRPENKVGAHAQGSNSNSIGICFEGAYMTETMPQTQIDAGRELVAYLKGKYGIDCVQAHRDVCSTDCPGTNFPFEAIAGASGSVDVTTSNGGSSGSGYDEWVARLQTECNAQGFSSQAVDGMPGPITLAGCPTLGRSSRGSITALVQERLNSWGYNAGGVDGINGPNTQAAIKAFQTRSGFGVDGIVGNQTWAGLLEL